jgi:ABC-2 type transport system permease protein
VTDHRPPGLLETVKLILSLRFLLFARRMTGRGYWGTGLAVITALGISGGLGVGGYLLFSEVDRIAANPVWMAFSLSLYFFLLGLFWVIWPVVAAQVDEAYELGRFFCYPVRPARLYMIQSLAALFEPAVLFFYPAMIGAALGLSRTLAPGWLATSGLIIAFTLMNVACGRFLQNLFLNVMTSRRSGEIIFAGFLVFLGLAAFIPPVDASWLFARLGEFGGSEKDLAILARTARALGNTPPGWLAMGLSAAAVGKTTIVIGCMAMMLFAGSIAWLLGLVMLKRYYRGGKGFRHKVAAGPKSDQASDKPKGWRVPGLSGTVSAIFEKEIKTLTSNPKARLLFAVPFFLLILLKIIGAPQLFQYLWGEAWAAVFLTLLCLYVLSVLSGQFFSNSFGYDGSGIIQTFITPVSPKDWLRGRNLAQAVFALVQFCCLGLLLVAVMPAVTSRSILLPILVFPFGLFCTLAAGNLLSIRYPRKFKFNLSRRDRPVGASFLWSVVVLGMCSLVVLAVLSIFSTAGVWLWLGLAILPGLGFLVYRLLFPVAVRQMLAMKESLIEIISA